MANRYDQGDLVHVIGTWTDPYDDDAAIDPDVVNVTVTDPSGTETTYVYGTDAEVVRSSVGVYYADIDVSSEGGDWWYRWWSTGTGQAAEKKKLLVDAAVPT